MKSNVMKIAVASALAAGAVAQANAAYFEPSTVTGAETYTLRVGGATAQDQGIVLLMRRLCSNGTMVRVTGTGQSAVMCEANGVDSAPIASGTKLVLYKNSAGGSGNGVNPVADATTLAFLNLASLTQSQYTTASICTLSTFASTADFADYKQYACGANIGNSNIAPDAGISDVEPSLLGFVSGTNGPLSVFSGPQVIFGVPVSKNFRDALQTAQGKTAGSDVEADMPSLNKAQLTSIMDGGIIPIIRFSDITGTQLSTVGLGAATIQVCRRVHAGTTLSGTAASSKAYFLNEGCSKTGVAGMVTQAGANNSIPPVAANRIHEYTTTQRVLGCLNSMNTANKYAVGMASLESVPGSSYSATGDAAPFDNDTGNWRWIKINGYAPTLLNVAQGKYDFVYEATWQHRASGNSHGELTGDPKSLFDKIVATNSAATVIKELNAAFVEPFGATGLIGRPSSGTSTAPSAAPAGVLTAAEISANPINTWTRAASGTPNSCNQPHITRETGLDYTNGL